MASYYTWGRVSHYITCCCYEVERMGELKHEAQKNRTAVVIPMEGRALRATKGLWGFKVPC